MCEQWWKNPPEEIRKIREQVRDLEISPVDSYAEIHLKRHGLEFEKQAIRDCLKKNGSKWSRRNKLRP